MLERVLRWAYVIAAASWAVALPLAAAAATTPHAPSRDYAFATLAYAAGAVICHQQDGRSFHLWGAQLPVCARCTGIYLGAALAAVVLAGRTVRARPRADRTVLIAACIPIALTLVFEWTTGITPSNLVRAASGGPAGAAVSWVIAVRRRAEIMR